MIPREVIRQIRRIQIHTSHIVDDLLAGSWHSAFKGRGIEFEEVRPYQVGDDVRSIDWNVTARAGEPFIKLFREERELSVVLLVDQSASQDFGTREQSKRELVAMLAATLAFSAIKNNDKVGLTLFTDRIEQAIPPRKGTRHVLRLIRELLHWQPAGTGTSLANALDHLNRTAARRSLVFLLSDFQTSGFEDRLKITGRQHDLIPIIVTDRHESSLPSAGLLRLRQLETGQSRVIDTLSRSQRNGFREAREREVEQRTTLFRRLKMEPIEVEVGSDFVDPLQRYFHRREMQR